MKKLIPIAIITILVAVYISGFNRKSSPDLKDKSFDYAFTIKDLDGNKVSFEEYKGKVVFLNLWATWCGPCRAEMPSIQKLYNKTQSDNIAFVMLSLDQEGDQKKVANYVKRNNFTFPIAMPSGRITKQLDVPSIPTTFIIDKTGKIVYQKIGTADYDTEKYSKMLLELSVR